MINEENKKDNPMVRLQEAVTNYNNLVKSFVKSNIVVKTRETKDGLIEALFFRRVATLS
jgi:N-dimethylarginine dimethylaminohydrolase